MDPKLKEQVKDFRGYRAEYSDGSCKRFLAESFEEAFKEAKTKDKGLDIISLTETWTHKE